jgi:hypothetical protein
MIEKIPCRTIISFSIFHGKGDLWEEEREKLTGLSLKGWFSRAPSRSGAERR